MNLLRKQIGPIVIILAAAFLVIFAVWPLENTAFADGFRSGEMAEDGADGEPAEGVGEEGQLTGIALLAPLIKVAMLMGVGVLFTSIGAGVIRLFRRFTIPQAEAP